MTLKPSQIHQILTNKREEFTAFNREVWEQLQQYRSALHVLSAQGEADVRQRLAKYS
ncbi:NurA domain-containing protein, partial [Leptolyngbya sp. FACHB-711]|nr:NurA domain-containing protein [Leptolyngbya sp. FACHB-711]